MQRFEISLGKPLDGLPHDQVVGAQMLEYPVGGPKLEQGLFAQVKKYGRRHGTLLDSRQHNYLVAITEHAELLGLATAMRGSDPRLLADEWGARTHALFNSGQEGRMAAFADIIDIGTVQGRDPTEGLDLDGDIWLDIVETVDETTTPIDILDHDLLLSGRPQVFVPMAVPMRFSNNGKCNPLDKVTSGGGTPPVYCFYDTLGEYPFGAEDFFLKNKIDGLQAGAHIVEGEYRLVHRGHFPRAFCYHRGRCPRAFCCRRGHCPMGR